MIISASRRCDIPRFRFDWFLQRLEAGYVDVINPFNAAQGRRVSLRPEDVDFLVFWTRDPRPLLAEDAWLARYPFYIMITLTGYPKILEPDVPPPVEIIRAMKAMSEKWGRKRVIWRYDPILFSSVTDTVFHCRNFTELAAGLSGSVDRVIISVYDEYAGAKRRFSALEKEQQIEVFPHTVQDGRLLPELKDLVAQLARIASEAGMEMRSCAEAEDFSGLGVKPGACIDGELMPGIPVSKDKNQRRNCRCVSSVDIGSYGSCRAGCVYCYAQR